ncbi:MAG TPA: hypothetical protein ENI95_05070 [Chloroflexi bacterium]|nr:hypothetical protein [Chloroflexota bacterium]
MQADDSFGRAVSLSPVTLGGVALLSAAMLAFELTLTRLFAVAQFYHFAFMVISLALLGSGASGSLLSVWPRLGRNPARPAAGFALAALLSYAILNLIPFDSYAIAWDRRQSLYLVLTFGGAALPFVFSGLVVGGLLAADVRGLHRVYAANLAGSALGGVIVLPLLDLVGGEGALFLSAALGLASAGLLMIRSRRGGMVIRSGGIAAGVVALVALAVVRPDRIALRLSPYKGLSQLLLTPDARHTVSEWSAVARVDVVESDSIHIFPGLSQNALIMRPPRQAALTLDGDNPTPITALSPDDELARTLAENVPQAVIAELRPPSATRLILEPGGGWDVLIALAGGAQSVTVAERNRPVIRILRGAYRDFTAGLYDDPRVAVVAADGRVYVRRTPQTFDVITVALSDSFHPVTSGAYSLGEDYRYTVEAVGDYLDRLSPEGLLVMTRWLQTPPTESLRTLATIEAALRARGVERPEEHIAAFRSMRTMTFVVGVEPLREEEREAIRAFADSRGYDLVWLPDISPDEVNRHSRLPEPAYYNAFTALLADPAGFVRAYEFDIRPPTDDRPFFFHYFRWRQTPEILATLGHTWQPFGGSGYFVLVALLLVVAFLAALLIFGPLVIGRLPPPPAAGDSPVPLFRLRVLIYFSMLGLGFLFVEIPLAQRFILFIGQPVTALAVVLFAVLLFSGIGSLTAPRWRLRWALAALVGVALATPLLLRGVFALALGWPLAARVAFSVLGLAPLGLLMGVPFARGTALIERLAPGLIPWAWAINGSASVISGVLAVMVALSRGFPAVLWLGAGAYALAWLAIGGLAEEG